MHWVPKTAWRTSNLNKTYGTDYIGLNNNKPVQLTQEELPIKNTAN